MNIKIFSIELEFKIYSYDEITRISPCTTEFAEVRAIRGADKVDFLSFLEVKIKICIFITKSDDHIFYFFWNGGMAQAVTILVAGSLT